MKKWSSHATEILIYRWEVCGWSGTMVAGELETKLSERYTRSMVMGKVMRLGLTRKPNVRHFAFKRGTVPPSNFKFTPVKLDITPPLTFTCSWDEVERGCYYPHENGRWCGAPRLKNSYCGYHYDLCYRPARYQQRPSLGVAGTSVAPSPHVAAGVPLT